MKVSKSPGIDRIYTKLLKGAGNAIIEPLLCIFNLSLNTGIFPDKWKLTPIYKSDDKTDCGDCRPILIISNIAKIFKKILYKQLTNFPNENNVIGKNQSGFRAQHSTETTLPSFDK